MIPALCWLAPTPSRAARGCACGWRAFAICAAIEELAAGRGVELDALGLARLVRGDPRQRVVICATALVRGSETVVGVGAIDVSATEPSLLVVDELVTDGLSGLLTAALTGRAASLRRARAGQPASTLTA